MSLIADALKKAQQEKAARDADAGVRDRRVVTLLAEDGAASAGGLGRAWDRLLSQPRSVKVATGVFLAALLVAAAVVAVAPRPGRSVGDANSAGGIAAGVGRAGAVPPAGGVAPGSVGDGESRDSEGPQQPEPEEAVASAGRVGSAADDAAGPVPGGLAPVPDGGEATAGDAPRFTITVAPAGDRYRPVDELFARAVALQKRGELARAAEMYERALEIRPDDPEIHNNLGTVYRSMGELEEARAAYRRALELNPDYPAAWNNLGVVHQALGAEGEARAAFQQALRYDPDNVAARVNLANQYRALEVYDEARRLLEAALERDPVLAEAHYALAQVLEARGDTAGAVRHYTLFLNTAGDRFAAVRERVEAHLRGLEGAPPFRR